MKPKTLLVLLAIVAALGGFIWFFEREVPSTEERAERAKRVFPGLEAKEVTAVVIERDGVKTVLEREPTKAAPASGAGGVEAAAGASGEEPASWRLVAPLAARADRAAVEALVASLASLARERTVEGSDRQAMGLVPPRATVTLRTARGEHRLEVGADVPASANLAVAVSGSADLAIAPRAFWTDLAKVPGDWRARDLFPGRRESIERVTITSSVGRVLLARRGEELWLESPLADRADRDLTGGFLTELAGLRAERFLDGASPAAMGAAPGAGVEVVLSGEKEPFRLELGGVGSDPSKRVARVGGQLVEISSRLEESLLRTPEGWRSRALSSFDAWGIDAVKVSGSAGAYELRRDAGEWKRGAETIGYAPIGEVLTALGGLRAERIGESTAASGDVRLTLELRGSDQRTETLTFFAEKEGAVPARASGRDAVLMLAKAAVDDLLARLVAVRDEKAVEATATPPPG